MASVENRIKQIMELDDNSKYVVVKQAMYKGESYYVAVKVTDDEEDVVLDKELAEENVKIFHQILVDGVEAVEEVEDLELFELIIKYLDLEEK